VEVYWLAHAESGMPGDDAWLGAGELTVLRRLRIPKRRADWRLGRWTAKRAIARYRGLPRDPETLAGIEIRPAPSGAPEAFIGERAAGLSLSLSHTDGMAFCALAAAGASVGCDIEKVAPHSQAFLADYFTAEEQDLVARTPEKHMPLTLLWSAKESALKALRCGLRADTRSVAVLPPGPPWPEDQAWHPLSAKTIDGPTFHGWWRQTGALVWTLVAMPAPLEPIALGAGPAVSH